MYLLGYMGCIGQDLHLDLFSASPELQVLNRCIVCLRTRPKRSSQLSSLKDPIETRIET
jgi:hypothetical protein